MAIIDDETDVKIWIQDRYSCFKDRYTNVLIWIQIKVC